MKTLINTALITSALFASQAFATGLSDFTTNSVESNLATGVSTEAHGFTSVISPLSPAVASTESHFSTNTNSTSVISSTVAHAGLEVPANSVEALL